MAAQSSGLEQALRRVEPMVTSLVRSAREVGGRMSDAAKENARALRRRWVERVYPELVRRAELLRGFAINRGREWFGRGREWFEPGREWFRRENGAERARMVPRTLATNLAAEVRRPAGVTIIGILTFGGAGMLALGSCAFFFVAVMALTGGDGLDPVSASMAGMGIAGGFSLLVLSGVAGCLAVGVLELQEWARTVSIGCMAVGIGCAVVSVFAFVGYREMPVAPVVLGHVMVIGGASWMLEYLARPGVRRVFRAATA